MNLFLKIYITIAVLTIPSIFLMLWATESDNPIAMAFEKYYPIVIWAVALIGLAIAITLALIKVWSAQDLSQI